MNDTDKNVIPIKGPDKFTNFLKKLSFLGMLVLILVILTVFAAPTMGFIVGPKEDAVILRFGKYDRTVGPGFHLKLPFNLEEKFIIPVRKILNMEFGFRTEAPGIRSRVVERGFGRESLMLTGDLNVVDIQWIIQYQIKNARNVLFNVRNVRNNLSDISQAVMRNVVGDHTFLEAISKESDKISRLVMERMQKILDDYKMGIHLVALKLKKVLPPDKVKPSYDEVNAAVQQANQIANLAEQNRRKLVQEERGKADQMVKTAEAYKIDLINRAQGDAGRFLALYAEYKKAPIVTKQRLYFNQLKKVLVKTDKIYIVDPAVKGIVPLLRLGGGTQ